MNFFRKQNKALDDGYKYTDSNCPMCKNVIFYDPKTKGLFCIFCEMPVKFEGELIDNKSS